MTLRQLREDRRWTRADFVGEFSRTADRLGYSGLSVTEKTVLRWEGPDPPAPRSAAVNVLEHMFRRPLSELGWPEDTSTSSDEFDEWTPESTIMSHSLVERSELIRRDLLVRGASAAAYAFQFFSSPVNRVGMSTGHERVGLEDVAAISYGLDELRHVDAKIGSAPILDASKANCAAIFRILRDSTYSETVGKQLFTVASEAANFAGWLHFDCGREAQAQSYFRLALRAAHHAGDDQAAASVFAFMSIQLYNQCEWDDALLMSGAAETLLRRYDSRYELASVLTRRARSLSGRGDAVGAFKMLDEAFDTFDSGPGADHPSNVHWINVGEIHGQASGCAALLGDASRAESEAAAARGQYDDEAARSSSLHELRVALCLAETGQIDGACQMARNALAVGQSVESFRFDEVKGDLVATLRRHADSRPVRELSDTTPEIFTSRLPVSVRVQRRLNLKTAHLVAHR